MFGKSKFEKISDSIREKIGKVREKVVGFRQKVKSSKHEKEIEFEEASFFGKQQKGRTVVDISHVSIAKSAIIVLLLLVLFFFLFEIRVILLLFFVSFLLAAALDPLIDRMQDTGIPRTLGVLLVYVVAFVLLGVFATKVITLIAQQVIEIAGNVEGFIRGIAEDGGATLPFSDTLKPYVEPIAISAYHNINIDQLISSTISKLKKHGFKKVKHSQKPEDVINISFIGKPNVGKSSLVNAIFGKQKVIVSDIPGTTRDTTDTKITVNEQDFNLIDTAGLRRRGKIERGLEKLSSFRALDAIERSDIVCLVLDYGEGVRKQDQHIASYALEAGKGLILMVNKSDLMENKEKDEKRLTRILRSRFEFLPWAPVIFVSALKKTHIMKIFDIASQIYVERFKQIPIEDLDIFLKEVIYKHMPASTGRHRVKFFSIEQVKVNPPTFVYKVNNSKSVHFSYRRYLENQLRERFQFTGTAIKLIFRGKKQKGRKK